MIREHESIGEVAVVAQEGTGGEKRLTGYVVEEKGKKITVSEMRKYLRERVPEYMVPGELEVIEEMPVTANGKIDRRALASRERGFQREVGYIAPRTAIEEVLVGIWKPCCR